MLPEVDINQASGIVHSQDCHFHSDWCLDGRPSSLTHRWRNSVLMQRLEPTWRGSLPRGGKGDYLPLLFTPKVDLYYLPQKLIHQKYKSGDRAMEEKLDREMEEVLCLP